MTPGLRLLPAAPLYGHGTHKLSGWFGGGRARRDRRRLRPAGLRPRPVNDARRRFTRTRRSHLGPGRAVVADTVAVPTAAASPNRSRTQQDGYEVAFSYGAVAAALAFTGPGTSSLDHTLGRNRPGGHAWGFTASAAALPPIARSRVLGALTPPPSTTR